MGDKTGIEWTDATWNPVRGCRRVSEGCRNCYAERTAIRMSGPGQAYEGLVRSTPNGPRWTGVARLAPEMLAQPLRWRKPQRVFVNSMSDLFHEGLSNEDIAAVFGVMAAAPQHTFQCLTKRPGRMLDWLGWIAERFAEAQVNGIARSGAMRGVFRWAAEQRAHSISHRMVIQGDVWPLPNVWLGVSVEDQATADERIPILLETPAAVRFISYEPALGPVEFRPWLGECTCMVQEQEGAGMHAGRCRATRPRVDWVIGGSESGPGARPAELDWFRAARDACAAAGVAFFFKQWVGSSYEDGISEDGVERAVRRKVSLPVLDGHQHAAFPDRDRGEGGA